MKEFGSGPGLVEEELGVRGGRSGSLRLRSSPLHLVRRGDHEANRFGGGDGPESGGAVFERRAGGSSRAMTVEGLEAEL